MCVWLCSMLQGYCDDHTLWTTVVMWPSSAWVFYNYQKLQTCLEFLGGRCCCCLLLLKQCFNLSLRPYHGSHLDLNSTMYSSPNPRCEMVFFVLYWHDWHKAMVMKIGQIDQNHPIVSLCLCLGVCTYVCTLAVKNISAIATTEVESTSTSSTSRYLRKTICSLDYRDICWFYQRALYTSRIENCIM